MLKYRYNQDVIQIQETLDGEDTEFLIHILNVKPYVAGMKLVQERFEENRIHTDVLFYAYPNHEYRVIVRRDFYIDFVLEMMKHYLLQSVEWMT